MPPLPPMQPLPPQITTSYIVEPSAELQDAHPNSSDFQPTHRPSSLSFSSSGSSTTYWTPNSKGSQFGSRPRTASAPFAYNGGNTFSSFGSPPLTGTPLIDGTSQPRELYILDKSATESNENAPQALFPVDRLASLTERSLAMHLYRSYQSVLACEEAMWEELKDRIRNRKNELLPFGWDDDEDLEELESRKKFERLVDRYRSSVHLILLALFMVYATNVHP